MCRPGDREVERVKAVGTEGGREGSADGEGDFTSGDERGVQGRRVTARDVGRLAGVSASTVSRVLSGKLPVSEETRERVLAAVQGLGYRPSLIARELRARSSTTVGLVVPDILDSYFHVLARGLEDAAREAGFSVILCNTDRDPHRERQYVGLLWEKQVRAVILAGGGIASDRHLSEFESADVRLVAIGPHGLRCPTIRVDNRAAIASAVRHLVEEGAERIGCIGGRREWMIHQVRLEGFTAGLESYGLEVRRELVWEGNFDIPSGRAAVMQALEQGVSFDGLVAFNDYSAIGAIEALKGAGLRVPEDVVVVGCDDIPLARLVSPSLSTISFPLYEFGRAAMEVSVMEEGQAGPGWVKEFPFHLVRRASSQRNRGRQVRRGSSEEGEVYGAGVERRRARMSTRGKAEIGEGERQIGEGPNGGSGLAVGKEFCFAKTVSESDVYAFAGVTGDFSPNHTNEEYMRRTRYERRIAHGALLLGYMSTCSTRAIESVGNRPCVSYGFDRIRFTRPVYFGDTVTVVYRVESAEDERGIVKANVNATNQRGEVVAIAEHLLRFV